MHRGYMAALLAGLGGAVPRAAVHRELRAMGLRKGVLTPRQARAPAHARPTPGAGGAALRALAVRCAACQWRSGSVAPAACGRAADAE